MSTISLEKLGYKERRVLGVTGWGQRVGRGPFILFYCLAFLWVGGSQALPRARLPGSIGRKPTRCSHPLSKSLSGTIHPESVSGRRNHQCFPHHLMDQFNVLDVLGQEECQP